MPITRVSMTDDDGSGTTGTIVDKSFIDGVYDSIEAGMAEVSVAFNAGNFTASGSQTWTVASGDQTYLSYVKFGKWMTVHFAIETTTVGGTPSTDLRITIPGGFTAAGGQFNNTFYYVDNGTAGVGLARVDGGLTYIRLLKSGFANWTASTNLTSVYGQIRFQTIT